MRVLLIAANRLTLPHPVYPLGVDHVAGALAARHDVRTLDLCDRELREVLPALAEHQPELVGLSLRNIDDVDSSERRGLLGDARELMGLIRGAWQGPVVLGGSGFTMFPDRLMAELDADYGVVGEGERVVALADALEVGGEVPRLVGVVRRGVPAPAPEPWEGSAPSPASGHGPSVAHYVERSGILNVQTQRGCPFRCIYCTYPAIEGRRLRRFPPDEVATAARRLQDAGASYLFFTDSVFNAHTGHSLAVAEALRRAGVTIPWGGFFAPRRLPAGYFERLRAAGLSHVEFGTDTLSDTVLRAYGKPFTVAEAVAAHADALSAGLHVAHFYTLGGPGETMATLSETLDQVEGLERTVHFFFCGVRIYPGTRLHEIALAEGRIGPDDDLLESVFYSCPEISPEAVLDEVRRRARGRLHWVVGSGGRRMERTISRMYARGRKGPLWEKMIP